MGKVINVFCGKDHLNDESPPPSETWTAMLTCQAWPRVPFLLNKYQHDSRCCF